MRLRSALTAALAAVLLPLPAHAAPDRGAGPECHWLADLDELDSTVVYGFWAVPYVDVVRMTMRCQVWYSMADWQSGAAPEHTWYAESTDQPYITMLENVAGLPPLADALWCMRVDTYDSSGVIDTHHICHL